MVMSDPVRARERVSEGAAGSASSRGKLLRYSGTAGEGVPVKGEGSRVKVIIWSFDCDNVL